MTCLPVIAVTIALCGSAIAGPARRHDRFEIHSKKLDVRMINAKNGVPLKRAEASLAWAQTAGGFTPGGILGDFVRHLFRR
jgi:hypothetical protein